MSRHLCLAFGVLVGVAFLSVAANVPTSDRAVAFAAHLDHKSITRTVDLTTHVEEQSIRIHVTNTGKAAVDSYLVPLSPERSQKLAFAGASANKGKVVLTVERAGVITGLEGSLPDGSSVDDWDWLVVWFPKPLEAKQSRPFVLSLAFVNVLEPLPASIAQRDPQLVVYNGDAYFVAPYASKTQKTHFKLSSTQVESYTKSAAVQPITQSGSKISAGEYKALARMASEPVRLHFLNNSPFITFTYCDREIEVSHWGSVQVSESIEVRHTGAMAKSGFSRLDYSRERDHGASFHTLEAHLPASVRNPFLVDRIGNVSTSRVRQNRRETLFQITPRYMLLGGWKVDFTYGYQVPSQEYLKRVESDDVYVLDVPFVHPFDYVHTENLTVSVVLPEGAEDIHVRLPHADAEWSLGSSKRLLDFKGRPVITLTMANVVAAHQANFQVVYRFSNIAILYEPLMVSALLFSFFCAALLWKRSNLSLTAESQQQLTQQAKSSSKAASSKSAAAAAPSAAAAAAPAAHMTLDQIVKQLEDNQAELLEANKKQIDGNGSADAAWAEFDSLVSRAHSQADAAGRKRVDELRKAARVLKGAVKKANKKKYTTLLTAFQSAFDAVKIEL